MEQEVLQLLQATTIPDTNTIRHAEDTLRSLFNRHDFPLALVNISSHTDIDISSRKAALTTLRKYVEQTWSPNFEEATFSNVVLPEGLKNQVRVRMLSICTSTDSSDSQGQALAASVVSKIASADFPDQWPDLFPHLVSVLNAHESDAATLGSLRVLYELVDSGLSDEQFFAVAADLVNALRQATIDSQRDAIVQAMALKVLSSCFDNLEQLLETEHAPSIKAFLNESMKSWMNYFTTTLRQSLPEVTQAELSQGTVGVMRSWKGIIALKTQIIKILAKIKRVHVTTITPHVFELFQILWEDLSKLSPAYTQMFLDDEGEGKLVDSDGLPYTLDTLIIEAVDFLNSALKAKAVRGELQKQDRNASNQSTAPWLQPLIKVMVDYSRIPLEEQGMWQIDANIYLSESTSVTANYTPRSACAELVARTLMEWLGKTTIHALVHYHGQIQSDASSAWREREALTYLLTQAMKDLEDLSTTLEQETSSTIMQQMSSYLQEDNEFLRGAAHLALGTLFAISSDEFYEATVSSLTLAIKSFSEDNSTIVSVCCLIVIPQYLSTLPQNLTTQFQSSILEAIKVYLAQHDLQDELEDSDDIKSSLITALRDTILIDPAAVVPTSSPALDLYFTLCSSSAANFMLSELMIETFELLVQRISSEAPQSYTGICSRIVPSLTAAFHLASLREESGLTTLAAELVSRLSEYGPSPLPDGYISTIMPPLNRVLMNATDASLLRPATSALTYMLDKDSTQYLALTLDSKSSIEITLIIINRLLNSPDVEEAASDNTGSLASTLVARCGAEKLGSHLPDLLRAIAIRLASATRIQFIQSLLMVFASLAAQVPGDVVTFLSDININHTSGLNLILTKWLENSVHFAGFDEIRQNAIALSKIYSLRDPRIRSITVKGDLVIVDTGRIKTRSQARVNPDTWTSIPADLKILKLLVDELKNAAVSGFTDAGAALAAKEALDEAESLDGEDDGEWEDDDLAPGGDGSLDLSSEAVRRDLMSFAGEGSEAGGESRLRDDESADYLINWFKQESAQPGFAELFGQLKSEEQEVLRELVK